ncbi:MAG: hypothetical protein KUG64_11060 [Cycloclasticus sp.]|nr:hypothetical protein [Cycloclasticus sp.]
MSVLLQIKEDNSNLFDILDNYESIMEGFEDNLAIEGKSLERANVEHASWMSYYDQQRIEMRSLMKHYEHKIETVRSRLWVGYTETMSIALTTRDKDMYINREDAYLEAKEMFLLVEELYKKYESVVELFKQRGFALRNITNVRVAALEDVIL